MGWVNEDAIIDGLIAAAGASVAAGVSETFDQARRSLRTNAPVGRERKSVHFAQPPIDGGSIRPGGRTRDTVGFAKPEVRALRTGDIASLSFKADIIMAPQGFYQDGSPQSHVITPVKQDWLGWIVGSRGGRYIGFWTKKKRTTVGGKHRGWIGKALAGPFNFGGIRAQAAWAKQFPRGRITPRITRDVLQRPFANTAARSRWFGEYGSRADIPKRERMYRQSRRAPDQWAREVARIPSRLR